MDISNKGKDDQEEDKPMCKGRKHMNVEDNSRLLEVVEFLV